MSIKSAIKDEKRDLSEAFGEPKGPINPDAVLSCKEFKLLSIDVKGDNCFRIKFMADNLSVQADLNLTDVEDPQLSDLFESIGDMILPKVMPDQKGDNVSLSGITRKDKNNPNKEPKTYFIFKVNNTKAFGYSSTSREVVREDLPEKFGNLFKQLETQTLEEAQRQSDDPQLNLFEDDPDSEGSEA